MAHDIYSSTNRKRFKLQLDVDSLEYSFLEQAEIQISRLREYLLNNEILLNMDEHRLYKYNPFEVIEASTKEDLDDKLVELLRALGTYLYKDKPLLIVDRRNPKNYRFDRQGVIYLKPVNEVVLKTIQPKRQALLLHIVAKVIPLIQENSYMSLRELYYRSLEVCQQNSRYLSSALDDLCCLLGCSRTHIRILSQPKGIVYGNLKIRMNNGEIIDCKSNSEGTSLPTTQTSIVDFETDARFLIILEKDSVLQRILGRESDTKFLEKYKAIIFTAKGYPDISSRAFLSLLWSKLKIPMFALTDADPHGLEIVCCYKFGCYSAASESQYLALPQLRWLGLLPSDVQKHQLSNQCTIKHSVHDTQKINSLYKRPYLRYKSEWIHQLNVMRDMKRKAELEAIDRNGEYLVGTYLPNKLRYASWI